MLSRKSALKPSSGKLSLLVLLILLLATCGGGTSGTDNGGPILTRISGNLSISSGSPVIGASITIEESGDSTLTASNGDFSIQTELPGTQATFLVEEPDLKAKAIVSELPKNPKALEVALVLDRASQTVDIRKSQVVEQPKSPEGGQTGSGLKPITGGTATPTPAPGEQREISLSLTINELGYNFPFTRLESLTGSTSLFSGDSRIATSTIKLPASSTAASLKLISLFGIRYLNITQITPGTEEIEVNADYFVRFVGGSVPTIDSAFKVNQVVVSQLGGSAPVVTIDPSLESEPNPASYSSYASGVRCLVHFIFEPPALAETFESLSVVPTPVGHPFVLIYSGKEPNSYGCVLDPSKPVPDTLAFQVLTTSESAQFELLNVPASRAVVEVTVKASKLGPQSEVLPLSLEVLSTRVTSW